MATPVTAVATLVALCLGAQGPPSACPWDCGDRNGVVDTVDFLALLSQWGQVGAPCDLGFGDPGVDTPDFLGLLASWGPCPSADLNVFFDEGRFVDHLLAEGKVPELDWDFDPHAQAPGDFTLLDSPLDIDTHDLNAFDPWTHGSGADLWPPAVDNLQFVANANPDGEFVNAGPDSLVFVAPPFNGFDGNVLTLQVPGTSLGLVSGPPAGDAHTALGMHLADPLPDGAPAEVRIDVYRPGHQLLGTVTVSIPDLGRRFVGLQAVTGTIGRVDLFETSRLAAGLMRVSAWQAAGSAAADRGEGGPAAAAPR